MASRIERAVSNDKRKPINVGALRMGKWMLPIKACYTSADLEIGGRTIVAPPVRVVQPNEEGRDLSAISLVAGYDIAENADDLARLLQNASDL